MTRLNLLLLPLVVISALLVVRVEYEARRAFAALDSAREHAQQLQLDHDRLQVEVRALSVPERIEGLARDTLGMVAVTAARTDFVRAPGGVAASVPTR